MSAAITKRQLDALSSHTDSSARRPGGKRRGKRAHPDAALSVVGARLLAGACVYRDNRETEEEEGDFFQVPAKDQLEISADCKAEW